MSDSGIQRGKGSMTFHPALRYDWTELRKASGFHVSRKVFSKLFLNHLELVQITKGFSRLGVSSEREWTGNGAK